MKYRIIKNGLDEFKVENIRIYWHLGKSESVTGPWVEMVRTSTLEEAEKYLKDYKKQMLDEKISLEKRKQITVIKEEEF